MPELKDNPCRIVIHRYPHADGSKIRIGLRSPVTRRPITLELTPEQFTSALFGEDTECRIRCEEITE